jgi:hypothetical protein
MAILGYLGACLHGTVCIARWISPLISITVPYLRLWLSTTLLLFLATWDSYPKQLLSPCLWRENMQDEWTTGSRLKEVRGHYCGTGACRGKYFCTLSSVRDGFSTSWSWSTSNESLSRRLQPFFLLRSLSSAIHRHAICFLPYSHFLFLVTVCLSLPL